MPMSKGKQMNSMPPMEVVTTGNRMSKGGMGKKIRHAQRPKKNDAQRPNGHEKKLLIFKKCVIRNSWPEIMPICIRFFIVNLPKFVL